MPESIHADTLNALNDMQRSITYAGRRPVLTTAERIIVSQEATIATRDKRIAELEAEVAKLTPLAVAVGACSPGEVPESVYEAFQMPAKYHADEVVRLREREAELEHRVRQLERATPSGRAAGGEG